jgi:hypothetical protein
MPLATPAVAIDGNPSVFDRLFDPSVRLAIWTRPNPCRLEGYPDYAEPTAVELACLPDWLSDDICRLGHLYSRLTGDDWRVRLETAEERTCPAFHEDAVRLRFLVTYRGPGTEWAADPDTGFVHQVPVGAVAAMKGRAWASDHRILHRSAKASAKRPRWVLAMDAATPSIAGPLVAASPKVVVRA